MLKNRVFFLSVVLLGWITGVASVHAEQPSGSADQPAVQASPLGFLERKEVRNYIRDISREHALDKHRIAGMFARLRSQQAVLDAISRPAEHTLTWREYRPIFVQEKRIDAGHAFIAEHRELLEQASREYGVPAQIIAAIIGVETFYGRIMGKHGVLESLATLAFDYPPRAPFFRAELTEFLVLSEAENWDSLARRGSYAGAMGMPQFIASSYRQFAVDFDADGHRDLFDSPADIIGSVANYLAAHGWIPGAPITEPWSMQDQIPAKVRALVRESLKPEIPGETLATLGFPTPLPDAQQKAFFSVMVLNGQDAEEVWVGYRNFYVITRYNHSRLYAMAVFQLAERLAEAIGDKASGDYDES